MCNFFNINLLFTDNKSKQLKGMICLLGLFKKKEKPQPKSKNKPASRKKNNEKAAGRKGEIGEYKIDIQLSQLPEEYKYLNDIMIKNRKSASGYSQIDHIIITPYGIFVVETKNYQGTIYGGKSKKYWLINGKFKMLNPAMQNYGHIQALKAFVNEEFHESFISLVSFTKRCTLKIDMDLRDIHADEIVIYDLYLIETINRKVSIAKLKHKEPFLSEWDIQNIYNALSEANITDPTIREQHIKSIREKNNGAKSAVDKCVLCGKGVSQKVKDYCMANKKFGGKVYCYEHQKNR
ncbi:nuclease-related domain-containing protein [Virgibacillus doumboii]|uniref:nuclease-related domain-containing protein n=1 Tax=Virgibacillus doumboii TaxID=2697503 RepID=UPI001FED0193|nr:nuclease-related domain-containing protein [Virgibacillus doumboii]